MTPDPLISPGDAPRRRRLLCFLLCCLFWPGPGSELQAQVDPATEAFPDLTDADWAELARPRSLRKNQVRLLTLLDRMANISNRQWQTWIAADDAAGRAVRLSGRLTGVSRITIDEQQASRFDCKLLYVASILRDDGGRVEVVSPFVPRALRLANLTPGQPVSCRGILITPWESEPPVLVAPRLEWYPDDSSQGLAPRGARLLARGGMDFGRMDDVENGSLQAFTSGEHELFRELVTAITRLEKQPDAVAISPIPECDTATLLDFLRGTPARRGQLVRLRGSVRRITPVRIMSPELSERIGQSTYYHVDFFVGLGKQRLELGDEQGSLILGGTFGLTLALFELPEGMNAADPRPWSVPGFFVKTWQHKTVASREISDELRRPNPIFFGLGSLGRIVKTDPERKSIENAIAWFWLFALIMVVAIFGVHWRGSRKKRQRLAAAQDTVDFSGLHDPPPASGP